MPRAGFEPAIPATKRPQTYALDRAAIGIGFISWCHQVFFVHIKGASIKKTGILKRLASRNFSNVFFHILQLSLALLSVY
jgi:hypothetical protein